jgi:hypothetical protein
MLDFTKLQHDVALAWDGNIEKRAANVDPDVYAVEVLRAEQNRLRLDQRISKSLNDLHKLFIKPCRGDVEHLFVLPIDDSDLNPHRCLELIKLIRLLNVPRLFILLLGDLWLIRHFMNFKYFQSIGGSGFNQDNALSNVRYDECELAHVLAGGANRKLFATASIVHLTRMNVKEVYDFSQTKGEDRLEKYLEDIKEININTAYCETENGEKKYYFGNLKIEKQHDLFNQKISDLIETTKDEKEQKNYFYIGKILYKLFPRLVQDIWLMIYTDTEEKKTDKNYYLTHAERLYRAIIRQERGLTTGSSIFLDSILREDIQGKLQIEISALELIYTYGQPINFPQSKTSITIRHPGDWYVELTHPLKSSRTPGATQKIRLNESTAAALIFIHDLLAFSDPTKIVGKNLMLKNGAPLWAYTQWPLGNDACAIKVPWHFPPWQTVFECDLLRRCWIEVWEWSNKIAKDVEDSKLINLLVYPWMRIITNILSKKENCSQIILKEDGIEVKSKTDNSYQFVIIDPNQEDKPWHTLLSDIKDLYADKSNQSKKRERLIRGWFIAIGCLLAPETNVPKEIRDFFAKAEKNDAEEKEIKEILLDPIIAGGIRKLRARSAALFFDNSALDLLNELFNPRIKGDVKLDQLDYGNPEVGDTPENFINVIGGGALCPFREDIVSLSKLKFKEKDKLEEDFFTF